jgi:hypothetical protein
MKRTLPAIFLCALLLLGCTSVPPETVKLSSAVGDQLQEIKKAHVTEINLYFLMLEQQTSRAVDEVYAPEIVKGILNGQSGQLLMTKLEAGRNGGKAAEDALDYTTQFLTSVRGRIERERATRLAPIEEAKARVLANTENAWSQAIQGNAIVTGYLASAVKVREAQDQLFTKLGVPASTETIGQDLAGVSDKIQKAVDQLNSKSASLDDTKKAIDDALAELKKKTTN